MAFIGPLAASENPLYMKDKVALKIAKQNIGTGDLIITERAFMWRPETRNDGISIPWTSVSLHAIASEPRSIYMQLDFRLSPWPGVYDGPNPPAQPNGNGHAMEADEGNAGEEDEDEGNVSDSSDDAGSTEIHITPQDENDINQIYYAMNHCQTMNPDPNESVSEDEEDFMEAEGDDSDDAGHGEMRNLHLNDDPDQFADD